MDINEVRKREEERLKKINKYHEEERQDQKKKKRIVKIFSLILAVSCILILCICGISVYIQGMLHDENGIDKISFLHKIPGGIKLVDENIDFYLSSTLSEYNNEKIDNAEVDSRFSVLERQNLSEARKLILSFYEEKKELYFTSKEGSILGKQYEASERYINAMDEYQKVIKEDSNYSEASAQIVDIKDKYINELIQTAYDELVANNNLKYICNLFNKAANYFPEDDQLLAYKNATEVTGNPLFYKIAETFCDELKKVEKDENHTEVECKEVTLYKISDACIIYSVAFHIQYPPACYFYYQVYANGDFEELSAEDFQSILKSVKRVPQTTIKWNEDLEKSKKLNLIITQMAELNNSSSEKTSTSAINEIKSNDNAMQERIENNNSRTGVNALFVVLAEGVAVLVSGWILIMAIKSMFK